ncbi:hypothetical protein ABZ747_33515 [Kitasatospora cineracea]|uniref:hypothetical protein n=1 Tax=Kitasatospora cineracea TaxID=88074 RepID=UPI0033D166C3
MESDEVMLTVRLTTAERTLLRRLAHGHRGDVSEVVADALLDVLPTLLAQNAPRPTEQPTRFAPCAVTVWLPPELAELLPALAAHLAQPPPRPPPPPPAPPWPPHSTCGSARTRPASPPACTPCTAATRTPGSTARTTHTTRTPAPPQPEPSPAPATNHQSPQGPSAPGGPETRALGPPPAGPSTLGRQAAAART